MSSGYRRNNYADSVSYNKENATSLRAFCHIKSLVFGCGTQMNGELSFCFSAELGFLKSSYY